MSLDVHTEEIAKKIVNTAFNVHKDLGPGLMESAYKECLYYELVNNGLKVEKEKIIPLKYKLVNLECGYRADLIVEDKVLLEIKAIEGLSNIHMAQILTYLRIGNFRLGFLINFNVILFKYGIKRVVI